MNDDIKWMIGAYGISDEEAEAVLKEIESDAEHAYYRAIMAELGRCAGNRVKEIIVKEFQ